jgi:hypothetical protein
MQVRAWRKMLAVHGQSKATFLKRSSWAHRRKVRLTKESGSKGLLGRPTRGDGVDYNVFM